MERKTTRDAAASLWEYALQVYARDGVAEACLAAQDRHGLDVNLLLFAAWLAAAGCALDDRTACRADDYCRPWREDVVQPLRRRRRAWKHAAPHPAAYTAIKALEIEAERQQLAMLAELAAQQGLMDAAAPPPPSRAGDLLDANLRVVAAAAGAGEAAVTALAAALGTDASP